MFWLHSPFLAVDAATIFDQALIPTSSTRLCTDSTYVPLAYNTQKALTCVDWLHTSFPLSRDMSSPFLASYCCFYAHFMNSSLPPEWKTAGDPNGKFHGF
jgi:hypothetical protein